MKKRTQIIVSVFFIFILLNVTNIQATEFHEVKNNFEKQIEKNLFDNSVVMFLDIWDILEFLFALLINVINFIIKLLQNFVRMLLLPLNLINYLICVILQILFPH